MKFDLTTPEYSYMMGFLHADGHHYATTRNRGKISVELNSRDRELLEKFIEIVDVKSRVIDKVRTTNFKENCYSSEWSVYDHGLRQQFLEAGLPIGPKSKIVGPPTIPFSEPDYYRGIIDGDGSLGFTGKTEIPFLSLITNSDYLATSFNELITRFSGKIKKITRNQRDDIYNIMVNTEVAQDMIRWMYYQGCLCLERKRQTSEKVLGWKRPLSMTKVTWEVRNWEEYEDEIVLSLPPKESAEKLKRTKRSVSLRRRRLRKRNELRRKQIESSSSQIMDEGSSI